MDDDADKTAATTVEGGEKTTAFASSSCCDTNKSAEAWVIDFSGPKIRRKATRKEYDAMRESQQRQPLTGNKTGVANSAPTLCNKAAPVCAGGDSEGNTTVTSTAATRPQLPHIHIDEIIAATTGATATTADVPDSTTRVPTDTAELIPRGLTTTRADLSARLVLSLPRLLCVNKQYPRSCGVSALTSVYNYLYSWIGESEQGRHRAPITQEEVMSELGFAPPFGEIPWGRFTGNATLMRWFHALNRRYGVQGRAYMLYKAHGRDRTTQRYNNPAEVLAAVRSALRDPHCALIYHCHNHYMVPVGYQDIPRAQVDFLRPQVNEQECETTVFVADVSRGKHDALYARRWSQIVQDIETASPHYVNIRQPHLGVQVRTTRASATATTTVNGTTTLPTTGSASATTAHAKPTARMPASVCISSPSAHTLAEVAPTMPSEDTTYASSGSGEDGAPDDNSKGENSSDNSLARTQSEESGVERRSRPDEENASSSCVATTSTIAAAAAAVVVVPQRARFRMPNNLHCLICFRNDEIEPDMQRFENASSASSSSSSSSSSESDNDSRTSAAAG